jgi:hypothetical protein
MGAGAAALGPGVSLVLGGALTMAYVGAFLTRDNPVRRYRGAEPEPAVAEPAARPR